MTNVLLFDCDGVLGDTERYGHLPAFNQMWQEFGVPWSWTENQYGEKLKIGGGKERMRSLFDDPDFLAVYTPPAAEAERDELIQTWHKRKSEIYKEIIASGKIPGRPGVKRVVDAALADGWTLGVCSTSAKASVEAVLKHAVGENTASKFSIILAGDVVSKKKPDPEIYQMAARELDVAASNCIVVEDSLNGLQSAMGANMRCVVTVNGYTRNEDFAGASLVVSCLGDDSEKTDVLMNPNSLPVNGCVSIDALRELL